MTMLSLGAKAQIPQLVKDMNPSGGSYIHEFTEYNSKLYYTADDMSNGRELWVSDGTTAGTQLFMDINPGIASADVRNFFEYAGKLFFTADDGTHGQELWATDGTLSGTQMVRVGYID